ncbi:hypothetical protein LEP1GSC052_2992 [Leptospira kmetyi serovar Malaysia str. Bejo-Iso9]|nr:hypothetical protein LEP1GSC052_2992 [Leptospira kmetyi serovar Malaysia str. Bejo-Iso9]
MIDKAGTFSEDRFPKTFLWRLNCQTYVANCSEEFLKSTAFFIFREYRIFYIDCICTIS